MGEILSCSLPKQPGPRSDFGEIGSWSVPMQRKSDARGEDEEDVTLSGRMKNSTRPLMFVVVSENVTREGVDIQTSPTAGSGT